MNDKPEIKDVLEAGKHGYDIEGEDKKEIARLRAMIEDVVDTLEAMDLHVDNPLYDRLRAAVEEWHPMPTT